MPFKIAQLVTIHFGYFWKNIFHRQFSKIAQFGHTGPKCLVRLEHRRLSLINCSMASINWLGRVFIYATEFPPILTVCCRQIFFRIEMISVLDSVQLSIGFILFWLNSPNLSSTLHKNESQTFHGVRYSFNCAYKNFEVGLLQRRWANWVFNKRFNQIRCQDIWLWPCRSFNTKWPGFESL